MAVQSSAGLIFMAQPFKNAAAMRRRELTHDLQQAALLMQFPSQVLQAFDFWLAQHTARQERWMGLFFENPAKVTLVSMLTAILLVLKQAFGVFDDAFKYLPWLKDVLATPSVFWLIFGISALFLGFGLGAFVLRCVLYRIAYQRDLIALATQAQRW